MGLKGTEIVEKSKIKNKRQVLRNCVSPELGAYILEAIEPRKASQS